MVREPPSQVLEPPSIPGRVSVIPSDEITVSSQQHDSSTVVTSFSTYGSIFGNLDTVDVPMEPIAASNIDAYDGLSEQFRLKMSFPALPPGATELARLDLIFRDDRPETDSIYRLRLHTVTQFHEYRFRLRIANEAAATSQAP